MKFMTKYRTILKKKKKKKKTSTHSILENANLKIDIK